MGGEGIRFGRKSGATLKRPRGGRRNVSAHQSICRVEKNFENTENFSEQFYLGSKHVLENGVQYSLNKRKRWTIPGILKDNIATNSMHDVQVRLVERHVLGESKRVDCIAVHSSKGKNRCRMPHKTFSHSDDLIGDASPSEKLKSSRRMKSKHADAEELTDPVPIIPEVRYEVCYCRPIDSFPHFNPSSKSKIKCKRNRFRNKQVIDDLLDVADDFWEEDYDEQSEAFWEDDDNQTDACLGSLKFVAPNLGQFITNYTHHKRPRQQIKKELTGLDNKKENRECPNKALKHSVMYFGKDAKINIVKNPRAQKQKKVKVSKQSIKIKNDNDEDREDSNCQDIPTICINICGKSCTSDSLLESFGDDYEDGESLPRKFSVNISAFLNGILKSAGRSNLVRKMEFWGHECFVIFITDYTDVNDDNRFIKMRISLFGIKQFDCCIYLDAFEKSLVNSRIYTVMEVIDTIRRLLSIHPPTMYGFDSLCLNVKPQIPLTNLSSVLNSQVEVMAPRLAIKCKALTRATMQQLQIVTVTNKSGTCGICDDDLLPSRAPSLALRLCQHWFCNECWRLYIESRIQRGDHTIVCPGNDCKLPVDNLSLRSLLSVVQFLRHKVHAQNQYVESNSEWHWCPRPQCGRVARVNGYSVGNAFLSCDCGLQSCLECKAEVHWPASCQQFEEYRRTVKKERVKDKPLITHVQVKRCPFCNQPMEKNGGCHTMICRCGKTFCWNCLHNINNCTCYGQKRNGTFENIELKSVSVVTEMSLLQQALNHHQTTSGIRKRRLQCTAKNVITKMFYKECKSSSIGKVNGQISTQTAPSSVKLQQLLILTQKVLQFFFETKKILEYSCVLMSYYTKREQSREVASQVARLEHIVKRLEEILSGNCRQNYTLDATETILQTLLISGNTCLKLLVHLMPKKSSSDYIS